MLLPLCIFVVIMYIIDIFIIDIEDLTLNSLPTILVFQEEDKGVAYPPLSASMTEVCSIAVPTLSCCFSFPLKVL